VRPDEGAAEYRSPRKAKGLTDLPIDLLAFVAGKLDLDDELATALSCRALREAVARSEHRAAQSGVSTSFMSLFGGSVARLAWATTCRVPLLPLLLVHTAAHRSDELAVRARLRLGGRPQKVGCVRCCGPLWPAGRAAVGACPWL
jgi:hypothetical protein